jgi:hypothetical protein
LVRPAVPGARGGAGDHRGPPAERLDADPDVRRLRKVAADAHDQAAIGETVRGLLADREGRLAYAAAGVERTRRLFPWSATAEQLALLCLAVRSRPDRLPAAAAVAGEDLVLAAPSWLEPLVAVTATVDRLLRSQRPGRWRPSRR